MNFIINIFRKIKHFIKPSYMSEGEIVNDMLVRLSDEDKLVLSQTPYNHLIMWHHTMGRYIRNHYLLWEEGNPYIDCSDPNGDNHPDQLSFRVIEGIWLGLVRLNSNAIH